MAKVEIEERAFNEPRLAATSVKYRVCKFEIMGYATALWRYSQQVGAAEATGEEILHWLGSERFSKAKRAVLWLLSADFIRTDDKNFLRDNENNDDFLKLFSKKLFKISGNVVAICKTQTRIRNARLAAKSRYQKDSSCDTHANRNADQMPYNIQVDKKTVRQENKENLEQVPAGSKNDRPPEHENLKPVGSKNKQQQTDGSKIWETYSAAYLHRYGIEPKRNATTSSQCANLAKRLGVGDAMQVVVFYLTHAKSYYVQNSHSIGICLKDAETLYTQMKTGNRVTASKAADIDRGFTQAEIFERVTRKLEQKYEGK